MMDKGSWIPASIHPMHSGEYLVAKELKPDHYIYYTCEYSATYDGWNIYGVNNRTAELFPSYWMDFDRLEKGDEGE